MSKRRQRGDKVYKIPGGGFCGEGLVIKVAGECGPCMLTCGDACCKEWSDCIVISDGGYIYHVSECQMEDFNENDNEG